MSEMILELLTTVTREGPDSDLATESPLPPATAVSPDNHLVIRNVMLRHTSHDDVMQIGNLLWRIHNVNG